MKKKIVIMLLSMTLVSSLIACSSAAENSVVATGETTETQATSADSVYNALTVKTDWETAATITFTESGMTIDGSGCTDEDGVLYITEGGAYTLTGASSDASIIINTEENVKLILNGVELTSTSGPVIYGLQVKNLYVEMAEGTTNTLTDGSSYETDSDTGEEIGKGVISCEDDLIILGKGTLNINACHAHGIVSDDKLYIEEGTINILKTVTDGLHANDLICIDGGTINIQAASDMMESEDVLVINDGTITGSSDDEGLESKNSLYINGGNIDIAVTDDGINAATYIEINGGDISINCSTGDAIDSNGNYDGCIVINGGNIYAKGGNAPEGAIDADNASAIINGGTVIAIGDSNSPLSDDGKQVTIVYGAFTSGEKIEVKDSSGSTVYEYTPEVSGNTMILSFEGLEVGESYTIYAAGEETQSFTAESTVVEAGGSANGMQGGMGGPGMGGGPGMNEDSEFQPGEGNFDGQMPENDQMPSGGKMPRGGQMPSNDSTDSSN